MREELGKYHGEYIEVEGEFLNLAKTGGRVNLLFKNITLGGEELMDHTWIPVGNVRNKDEINKTKLKKHTIYKIRGKVQMYRKRDKESGGEVYDFCFKSVRITEV